MLKDPNAQKLELLAQSIDVAPWMATKEVKELMEIPEFNKNYDVQFIDNYSYNYIGLNMRPDGVMRKKIFDDVRVRRAMALVIPVEEFIQAQAYGHAKRQVSINAVPPIRDVGANVGRVRRESILILVQQKDAANLIVYPRNKNARRAASRKLRPGHA